MIENDRKTCVDKHARYTEILGDRFFGSSTDDLLR
ncbi:MAG: Uncharacterized protein AWU56_1559 [Idiomarina sp. T82-3]|jgi:hypothetical protein|uniref:Uncharacterized protein n=1 Tax=Idiomarina baltica OS145 TaxID=314276 RepID=A0ABM9WQ93_9GAMM|nr:hypothetical protein OS145_02350 [Idiomarina baltica OS145]KXS34960.1 MAG: Uncharacterized protein AWU56_1559 [Idiomarina sp. T82-3]